MNKRENKNVVNDLYFLVWLYDNYPDTYKTFRREWEDKHVEKVTP